MSLQLNEDQGSHGGYIVLLLRLRTLIRKTITRVSYRELGRDVLGQVLIWNTGLERQNFHAPLWKRTEAGPTEGRLHHRRILALQLIESYVLFTPQKSNGGQRSQSQDESERNNEKRIDSNLKSAF